MQKVVLPTTNFVHVLFIARAISIIRFSDIDHDEVDVNGSCLQNFLYT